MDAHPTNLSVFKHDGKSLEFELNFLPASVDAVCLTFFTPVGLCPSQQFPDDEVSSGVVPLLPLLHNFTFITAMYLWKRSREGGWKLTRSL